MSDKLLEYASTPHQEKVIKAYLRLGSARKASKDIGIDRANLSAIVRLVKKRAALAGYSPEHDMTKQVPEGFTVKGTSTMYDDEGNVKLQWVKTSQAAEQMQEAMEAAMQGFRDELPKAFPIPESRISYNSDLLNQFTITDFHLGMKAWAKECGDDWDTDIAEALLVSWFAEAIRLSPNAATAILANIADFMHWDGVDAVTPASKHILDADTRFQRLIRVAIRVLRKVIAMLLEKHENVHIIMAEGNHDPASSMWLREWFDVLYEDEPRVTVDTSARPYYFYEFGKTLLLYHHGHKRKIANIDTVFAGLFRKEFGRSEFAYAHMGHLHSVDVKETNLMIIEQHRTLAAPDAYASRGGWISGRDAKVITYHKDFGEVGRITISPDMVNK